MLRTIVATMMLVGSYALLNKTAGAHAALDISVVEQAKDVYFDNLVNIINNLTIPDIEDDKGNYMRGNSFVLDQRTDDVIIYTDVGKNALVMRCNKLSGVFYNDAFRYKETIFVAKGHSDVIINTILVQFGLALGTTDMPDGRTLPYFTGVDVDVNINRFDINIQIWGNIWSDLASLFEVFFVGTVADLIETAIRYGTGTTIPAVANHYLQLTDGFWHVPAYQPYWTLDWETQYAADVTETYVGVGIKGLMFDDALPEVGPEIDIPVMPMWNSTKTEKFQSYVSSYSIDSLFQSWIQVGDIDVTFYASMIPANSSVQLTTTSLNGLMPGIEAYYGANVPVDIEFNVTQAGNVVITEANQELEGEMTVITKWWVHTSEYTRELAATVTLANTIFGFTVVINNMDVAMNLQEIKSTDVTIDQCAFGELSARTFKLKLNFLFTTFKIFINQWLDTLALVVPSNILGIFILSDLYLEYYNDYVYMGATPTFIGSPEQAAAMLMYKQNPELVQ